MLEEVEEVVEQSGENNGAVPVQNMKDRAREAKVRGLYHLSTPELEDGADGEYHLEEGESLSSGVVLKDMFTSDCEERNEL